MKTSATLLTEQMRTPAGTDKRDGNPEAIYAIVMDGRSAHCMTQGMIDAWWNSLAPVEKAEIHEQWLDAELHADMAAAAATDRALATLRDPLCNIYAAAEALAADHCKPFTPEMPTFSAAELALLQRQPRRAGQRQLTHHLQETSHATLQVRLRWRDQERQMGLPARP